MKKLKLFLPLFFVCPFLISIPFITISCSSSTTTLKYDGTYESLKIIVDKIESSDFIANLNLKLDDVKESDIKWKNANLYPNLKYEIFNLVKEWEYHNDLLDETYKNVVSFKIKLIDKNNLTIEATSKFTYFIYPFK